MSVMLMRREVVRRGQEAGLGIVRTDCQTEYEHDKYLINSVLQKDNKRFVYRTFGCL